MIKNPIVDEVHRVREEMLARHGGNLHALVQEAERFTAEAAKAGRLHDANNKAAKQEKLTPHP